MNHVEAFVRENTCLYRHYCIEEVQGHVAQFVGVQLTDEEAVALVQKLRDENDMGPIAEHNMPGYVSDEE